MKERINKRRWKNKKSEKNIERKIKKKERRNWINEGKRKWTEKQN